MSVDTRAEAVAGRITEFAASDRDPWWRAEFAEYVLVPLIAALVAERDALSDALAACERERDALLQTLYHVRADLDPETVARICAAHDLTLPPGAPADEVGP